jgi:hypothetical protein
MPLYLLALFTIAYVVAVDKNVADYLYLKFVAEPRVTIQTTVLKYYFLARLKYDMYQIKRGVVSKKYMDMAKEVRDSISESE